MIDEARFAALERDVRKPGGFIKGQRDHSDVSYRRPVELDEVERL